MKVSYITATLGTRPEYLTEAGRSLASQIDADHEWIVISPKNIDVPPDARLIVSPGNFSTANNVGLKNANGHWISFLGDDDLKLQNFERVMVKRAESTGAAICVNTVVDKDGLTIGLWRPVDMNYEWNTQHPWNPIPLNGLLVRKEAVPMLFDEELDASEDWDFILQLMQVVRIEVVSEELAAYRKWVGQSISNPEFAGDKTHKSMHRIMEKNPGINKMSCGRC